MKTAVIYHSYHHLNTKRVLDHIAGEHELLLLPAAKFAEASFDYSAYDLIGFASGIYAFGFHPSLSTFVSRNPLPAHKAYFLLYTAGMNNANLANGFKRKHACLEQGDFRGCFNCQGFDTFGPFKLVGGLAKGRPNQADLAAAMSFYEGLIAAES